MQKSRSLASTSHIPVISAPQLPEKQHEKPSSLTVPGSGQFPKSHSAGELSGTAITSRDKKPTTPDASVQRSLAGADSDTFVFDQWRLRKDIDDLTSEQNPSLEQFEVAKGLLINFLTEPEYTELRARAYKMLKDSKTKLQGDTALGASLLRGLLKELHNDKSADPGALILKTLSLSIGAVDERQRPQSMKIIKGMLRCLSQFFEQGDIREPAGYYRPEHHLADPSLTKDQYRIPLQAHINKEGEQVALTREDIEELSRCSFVTSTRQDTALYDKERWEQLSENEKKQVADNAIIGDKSFVNDCVRSDLSINVECGDQLPLATVFSARSHELKLQRSSQGIQLNALQIKEKCSQEAMRVLREVNGLNQQGRSVVRNLLSQGPINDFFYYFFKKILPRHGIYVNPTLSTDQVQGKGKQPSAMELNFWKNGCMEISLQGTFEGIEVDGKKLEGNDIRLNLSVQAGMFDDQIRITQISASVDLMFNLPGDKRSKLFTRPALWLDFPMPVSPPGKKWEEQLKTCKASEPMGISEPLPEVLKAIPAAARSVVQYASPAQPYLARSEQGWVVTNQSAEDQPLTMTEVLSEPEAEEPPMPVSGARVTRRLSMRFREQQRYQKQHRVSSDALNKLRTTTKASVQSSLHQILLEMHNTIPFSPTTTLDDRKKFIENICKWAGISRQRDINAIIGTYALTFRNNNAALERLDGTQEHTSAPESDEQPVKEATAQAAGDSGPKKWDVDRLNVRVRRVDHDSGPMPGLEEEN